MTLEALANELLLELFKFLDVVELFRAFHGLNSRFNVLLFTQFRAYHINFHSILKYQSDFLVRQYLPLIFNQIISLRLSDNDDEGLLQSDIFFSSGLMINQFTHLRSLSLSYITDEKKLNKIIVDCRQLLHLTHLKIVECDNMNSVEFSSIIWSLPKLTHCQLEYTKSFIHAPMVASSSIEYLSIACKYWWLYEAAGLFQQTPYLCRFHVLLKDIDGNLNVELVSLPSIRILELSNVRSLNGMRTILLNMPNLIQLKVDMYGLDCDGYLWEGIIDEHLPKLEVFHLRMHMKFHREINNKQTVDNLVDSFRTRFWLEKHQWYIRCHEKFERYDESILLYSLPYVFSDFDYDMLTVPYKSTCSQDNDHHLYDRVNKIHYTSWFCMDRSFIQFFNIRNLTTDVPFEENFWKIIPTINQLNSLTVLSVSKDVQIHLQSLLDRLPYLYSLKIASWPESQVPVLKNTNGSVRRLDLRLSGRGRGSPYFNREECNTFIRSLLAMQCEELLIKVENCESILDLVNNMGNLRILHIQYSNPAEWPCCSSHNFYYSHIHSPFNSNYSHNERPNDKLIDWLPSQLSPVCIISKFRCDSDGLNLWINLKKP